MTKQLATTPHIMLFVFSLSKYCCEIHKKQTLKTMKESVKESFKVNQENAFKEVAMELMNCWSKEGGRAGFERRFKAFFGVKPRACVEVWRLLMRKKWFETKNLTDPREEKAHILWALRFLKSYSTEEIHAAEVTHTKKTWRKWTWMYVEAIASCADDVVSFIF